MIKWRMVSFLCVARSTDSCNPNSDRRSRKIIEPGYFLMTWILKSPQSKSDTEEKESKSSLNCFKKFFWKASRWHVANNRNGSLTSRLRTQLYENQSEKVSRSLEACF